MSSVRNTTNGTTIMSDENRQPLNIIIPIGGIGSRFAKHGYRYPKPLINIVGRPMLLWLLDSLSLQTGDTLWIAVNEDIDDEFRIGELITKSLGHHDHRILRLRHRTKGASETLHIVSQSMTKKHLDRRTVSLDCDTLYWFDILSAIRNMPSNYGGCFYFPDDGDKPTFSYIKTEAQNGLELIVDIQEKKAISTKANTGAYVFPTARELRSQAGETIDIKHCAGTDVGEYYTSQLVAHMMQNGVPFIGLPVARQEVCCVGTPRQLQEFLQLLKDDTCKPPITLKKRRFCFDLDMTLVGAPIVAGDYSTCPPIKKNIALVQQLFKAGHYIIIQTARRMRTHGGNAGSVLADVGPVTFTQLAKYEVPFHEIHFGKPHADVYVDDLAVNANIDTMREIGWLVDDQMVLSQPEAESEDATHGKPSNMIPARDFNTIQIIGNKVVKSSKSENILGEVYFYSHMSSDVAHLFPTVYGIEFIAETSTYTITMENCRGLTFSHMLVGRSITKGRFLSALEGLRTIHTAGRAIQQNLDISAALEDKLKTHSLEKVNHRVNIYANYVPKLRRRYQDHRGRYDALGPLAASLFSRLCELLDTYEVEQKAVRVPLIHGDPVFSNIILSEDENAVRFIDVRCQLGNTLTPEGDVYYDLAKVLQSLCGYDHVLFVGEDSHSLPGIRAVGEQLLQQADKDLLEELQEYFFTFVENAYPVRLHRKTLFQITASLLFTLIPLHRAELGAVFLRMCEETLEKANSIGKASVNGVKHSS